MFLPAEDLGEDLGLERGRAKVEHGRKADDGPRVDAVAVPPRAAADEFLSDDELSKRRNSTAVFDRRASARRFSSPQYRKMKKV